MKNQPIVLDLFTQNDFLNPGGKLFLSPLPNWKQQLNLIFQVVKTEKWPVISLIKNHQIEDFSENLPSHFFPPHCLNATDGKRKWIQTVLINHSILNLGFSPERLSESLGKFQQYQIEVDQFHSKNDFRLEKIIDFFQPSHFIILGLHWQWAIKPLYLELLTFKKPIFFVKDLILPLSDFKTDLEDIQEKKIHPNPFQILSPEEIKQKKFIRPPSDDQEYLESLSKISDSSDWKSLFQRDLGKERVIIPTEAASQAEINSIPKHQQGHLPNPSIPIQGPLGIQISNLGSIFEKKIQRFFEIDHRHRLYFPDRPLFPETVFADIKQKVDQYFHEEQLLEPLIIQPKDNFQPNPFLIRANLITYRFNPDSGWGIDLQEDLTPIGFSHGKGLPLTEKITNYSGIEPHELVFRPFLIEEDFLLDPPILNLYFALFPPTMKTESPLVHFPEKKIITLEYLSGIYLKGLQYLTEWPQKILLEKFLPDFFTLSEAQGLFEGLKRTPLDRRNFRKQLLQGGLILPTPQFRTGSRRRPPRLYTLNPIGSFAN